MYFVWLLVTGFLTWGVQGIPTNNRTLQACRATLARIRFLYCMGVEDVDTPMFVESPNDEQLSSYDETEPTPRSMKTGIPHLYREEQRVNIYRQEGMTSEELLIAEPDQEILTDCCLRACSAFELLRPC